MRSSWEREFADFFDRTSPRLLSAAWLLTGDRYAAEDLAQEALARTYARWAKVRTGHPQAFARRVLVNLHIDSWRKRRREVLVDTPPEHPVTIDSQAVDLQRALAALTTRQRQCVVLRHYLDLSERDTAATLGIGVGSVKGYTRDGLRRLRAELLEGEESYVGGP